MSVPLPPLFSALRQSLRAGYGWRQLRGDLSAGLTVGIIAIPLAMALAIAVGVAPQHGLYTVLVAGTLIALFGGSRFNVSGPTAAFVVILLPVTLQFGLGGLLLCTLMAGAILIALGLMRAGRLIEFIPYPVTLGFTAGIGIVIATLQIKDLLGLQLVGPANNYLEQLSGLWHALPSLQLGDSLVTLVCLAVLLIWPRWVPKIPGHLVALAVGALLGLLLAAGVFIKRMSDLTDTAALPKHFHQALNDLPEHVLAYAIRGPLFFGAAEKALSVLRRFTPGVKVVIVDISAVPLLDMTAIAALDNVLRDYRAQQVGLVLSGPTPRVRAIAPRGDGAGGRPTSLCPRPAPRQSQGAALADAQDRCGIRDRVAWMQSGVHTEVQSRWGISNVGR